MSYYPLFANSFDSQSHKIDGVMVGIVTNNDDPEKLGRVKLKLPIREGADETDWVRVATFMGGADRGSFFVPEVNDEVLVAFHLGEVRQPFVIGVLWNKKQKPPISMKQGNHIRSIKSRSGHTITFDDNPSGNIEIKTNGGHLVSLDDKNRKISINDSSNNNCIEINGTSNEIMIKSSSSTVKINSKGEVSIDSPLSVNIKSTQVNVEAKAAMTLKAGASLDVKCDGMINIKGSLVKIN